MDDDLAAARAAAAQRYAAATAAAPAPREDNGGGAGGSGSAADSDEALARHLQAEEDARGAGGAREASGDDDDDVQIIDPPPAKRQRAEGVQALPWESGIGWRLSHVAGLAAQHNAHAVKLEEIVPLAQATSVKWVLLTNYQFEFPWLLDACPALQVAPAVFMLTSSADKSYSGIAFVKANLPHWQTWSPPVMPFGTHHSKSMIVVYNDRCRVCVHTANYLSWDWGQKSEGVWLQDFPLKPAGANGTSSAFEDDLVAYLEGTLWPGGAAPGVPGGVRAASLRAFDFSSARVALVGSVPGSYTGAAADRWGYRRVAALLRAERFNSRFVGAPLVCQYTSTGSIQPPWLLNEFFPALSAGRTAAGAPLGDASEQRLVWPTEEEVRTSKEGWAAGTSIPGNRESIRRPHIMQQLCRWAPRDRAHDTCPEGRAECMPHMKTFLRHNGVDIAWLLLCSHNLSAEAAWGKAYAGGTFRIKSYELGVLFLPSLLSGAPGTAGDAPVRMVSTAANGGMAPGLRDGVLAMPLPYMLPPQRYAAGDEPWDWQTARTRLDSKGLPFAGVSNRH